mgnify:CR=1 FL=1
MINWEINVILFTNHLILFIRSSNLHRTVLHNCYVPTSVADASHTPPIQEITKLYHTGSSAIFLPSDECNNLFVWKMNELR